MGFVARRQEDSALQQLKVWFQSPQLEYDIVIVGGVNVSMPAVLKEAQQLGLDEDKIVLDRTVMVPGFNLKRYKILRHSQLSILSANCWGGLISHLIGLQFKAPTVNMYIGNYMKLLSNPQYYFNKELRFVKMTDAQFKDRKWKHPVFALGVQYAC